MIIHHQRRPMIEERGVDIVVLVDIPLVDKIRSNDARSSMIMQSTYRASQFFLEVQQTRTPARLV
jgi:hypothetical protein